MLLSRAMFVLLSIVQTDIGPEIAHLKELNEAFKAATAAEGGEEAWSVPKAALDNTLTRRMFVIPSFEVYNGVAGLFDFGPPGTAFKDNLLNFWRRHFVYEEGMLQLECSTLTPKPVLDTSGHVEKFADLMVKDSTTGECFRADKLLEDVIEVRGAWACVFVSRRSSGMGEDVGPSTCSGQ